MWKLLKSNIFVGLSLSLSLVYNIQLFNVVDLAMYGKFTMIMVYLNFIGAIAFSPFSEGMQVFYRESNNFGYVQLTLFVACIFGALYLLIGAILTYSFYHALGGLVYLLPLGFALGPLASILRGLIVIDDYLIATYIVDIVAVSLQIAVLYYAGTMTYNYLFSIYFIGFFAKLVGCFLFIKLFSKYKLWSYSAIKNRDLRKKLWDFARPLVMVRTISPLYKNADRAIYALFLNESQLGLINFMLGMFNKLKTSYKAWFSLRLPHLYKDAYQQSYAFLIKREIWEARLLVGTIIIVFVPYIVAYQFGFLQFQQEKWNVFIKYGRFLIIPILFQIILGMSGSIVMAKKETKALAILSVFSIISFLAIAYIFTFLFQFDGAFFSTLIYRESWSSLAPILVMLYLYSKAKRTSGINSEKC